MITGSNPYLVALLGGKVAAIFILKLGTEHWTLGRGPGLTPIPPQLIAAVKGAKFLAICCKQCQ